MDWWSNITHPTFSIYNAIYLFIFFFWCFFLDLIYFCQMCCFGCILLKKLLPNFFLFLHCHRNSRVQLYFECNIKNYNTTYHKILIHVYKKQKNHIFSIPTSQYTKTMYTHSATISYLLIKQWKSGFYLFFQNCM